MNVWFRKLRPFILPAAGLALVLALSVAAEACPSCKSAVATDEAGDPIKASNGYYWSILFMIGVSYSIIAGFGLKIYLMYRKGMKARAAGKLAEIAEATELASKAPVLVGHESALDG